MSALILDQLQVLVTGVDAAIARDVVRLVAAEGASVTAADRDPAKLARLERDLGLYRTHVETAPVDLGNQTEVRLWEQSLGALGRLPHVMICCCGASAPHVSTPARGASSGLPSDVALSEGRRQRCPAGIAERTLQPTLFLHAEPTRRSVFDRALAVLRHPTLRGLLERAPGQGVFNAERAIPYVRIASQVYSLRRQVDGAPFTTDPSGKARLRLIPPNNASPRQADAA